MLAPDRRKRGVGSHPALRQRTIGHQRNRFLVKKLAQPGLVQHDMVFDLVAGDRGADVLDHGLQQRNVEIGDADGAGAALFLQLHQRLEHRGQIHLRRWPVHQVEIDLIEPELVQGCIERPADGIRRQVLVPDLGGDVQILAGNAGGGNRGADRLLIAVHLRGVEMPIAEPQRAFNRGAAGLALHTESAQPEPGQTDALGLQMFHGDSGRECTCGTAAHGISLREIGRY